MSGPQDTTPYLRGLSDRQWLMPFCDECGEHFFYPRAHCPYCFAEGWEFRPLEVEQGVVETWTAVHRGVSVPVEDLPLYLGLVALAPRVRLLARITGPVAAGDVVTCDWDGMSRLGFPVFEVA